jgi:Putative Ig domain
VFTTSGQTRTLPAECDPVGAAGPTYAATGLPAGLSMTADGVISGTVTETGTSTVTITTSGAEDGSNSVTFAWIVL